MHIKELVEHLNKHIEKNPGDAEKDIFRMQLDLAATKENIKIIDNN